MQLQGVASTRSRRKGDEGGEAAETTGGVGARAWSAAERTAGAGAGAGAGAERGRERGRGFCTSEKPAGFRREKERENLRWGEGRSMEAIFGKQEVEGIKKGA